MLYLPYNTVQYNTWIYNWFPLSPVKYSEWLTLLLFYSPLYIFPIQDSERVGRRGRGDQRDFILAGENGRREFYLFGYILEMNKNYDIILVIL